MLGPAMSWLETYRGAVYRWEVDNVDHFTVAYYFARFDDATAALLDALGLGRAALAAGGRAAAVVHSRVRYLKELRVGDILHVRSGVAGVDDRGLDLVHELYDSGADVLCTTVEERAVVVDTRSREPRPLTSGQRAAADDCRVAWTPEADAGPVRRAPAGDVGFVDTARDSIKPWEVDALGLAAAPAYIHRFSAANGHILAAFGMTPAYMRDQQRGLSTFEFRLSFPGALRAGDFARVQSALVHVGNSSMRIFHRMTDARTGAVVATLEQSGVHLDMVARRPAPLPDELRARAKAMLVTG
jgi:acyl-CoA thioesterase FadM